LTKRGEVSLTNQNVLVRIKKNQKEGIYIMTKTITLRLSDEEYQLFLSYAKADNRTLANAIETLAHRKLEESFFVDQFEMEEILSNKDLLKRMKTGSQQAKKMRGRFVE